VAALELDERDQVEDVLVLRAKRSRLLELAPRFFELALAHAAPGAREMNEERTLVGVGRVEVPGGVGHGQ
jgi:hypothetical protein